MWLQLSRSESGSVCVSRVGRAAGRGQEVMYMFKEVKGKDWINVGKQDLRQEGSEQVSKNIVI